MLTKLLKINSKDYSQIYFTSDSHFGHEPKSWSLAEKRGFKNIQEHDEWQLQFYRNTLPTDLIIHTGDFALNTTPERFIKIVKDTPSKIMMWWGNHESPTSNIYKKCLRNLMVNNYEIYPLSLHVHSYDHYDAVEGYDKDSNFIFMGNESYLLIDGQIINIRHMAPAIWDKMKHDAWSICGHSHSSFSPANPNTLDKGKILDVGVENSKDYNGTPFFTLHEVKKIMNSKKTLIVDHHGDSHI
jgi:calcineurin-like phosphoesterase family protein